VRAGAGDAGDEDDVLEVAGAILANPQEVREVAKNAGLSEDVFRAEMGEMREDLKQMGQNIEAIVAQYGTELSQQLSTVEANLSQQMTAANSALQEQLAILRKQIGEKERVDAQRAATADANQQQMMEMLQKALLGKSTESMMEEEVQAHTKLVEAQILTINGDDAAAKAKVEEATELHRSAESEMARGVALSQEGKLAEAVEAYRSTIKMDPDSVGAWFGVGYDLWGVPETEEEQIRAFRQCLRIDPNHFEAHANLGNLLMKHTQQYPEAEAEFRAAIAINPNHPNAHCNLGVLLMKHMQQYPEAEAEFRASIAADPQLAQAHGELGVLLMEHMNQHLEAEAELRAAIAIDPKIAWIHLNLGILLNDQQQYLEAEAEYRAAIAIDPEFTDAHYNLGVFLGWTLNRWVEAAECMRTAAAQGNTTAGQYVDICEAEAKTASQTA
jgi:tetratricopeptide (TPR) repeat protein